MIRSWFGVAVAVLAVAAAGCAAAAPAATAPPVTTAAAFTPDELLYLDEVAFNGIDIKGVENELVTLGRAVCESIPVTPRAKLVEMLAEHRPSANAEALASAANRRLCPGATFPEPPRPPDPNTIREGTYEVGVDVAAGKYKTPGGETCYWARLRNDASRDIIDIGIGNGPQTVTIKAGELFETQRCAPWTKVA